MQELLATHGMARAHGDERRPGVGAVLDRVSCFRLGAGPEHVHARGVESRVHVVELFKAWRDGGRGVHGGVRVWVPDRAAEVSISATNSVEVSRYDPWRPAHGNSLPMVERQHLLSALKRILKERGWRYVDLAAALGISEPTVKRILSSGRMDLERLEQICGVLDIDFFELARSARGNRQSRRHLTLHQETDLAAEPRLMTVFHLLCQGWRTSAIGEGYGLRHTELVQLLARLDKLRLVELLPGN
ncbi:MAG: helix-turn-helix transcriptional regulator, partial [Pseudoxanthomonas sp.]